MAQNNVVIEEKNNEIAKYTRWATKVVNGLLREYTLGQSLVPETFALDGVNIVRLENGKVSVGFVFKKEEGNYGTR